jgi:hypothetical protein
VTETELRALYTEAVKIVRRERKMRQFVFRADPLRLQAKVAEMDRLEHLLTQIKDAAKRGCDDVMEQATLLDVPPKAEYP